MKTVTIKITDTTVTPTPSEIKAARKAVKLNQTQAGALVYVALRTWQQWEKGDRKIPLGLWELFNLKIIGSIDIRPNGPPCTLCGYQFGYDWLDGGVTCPRCKLVQ